MTWAGPKDFLHWAKYPKSDVAVRTIQSLAARDRRFAAIWGALVEAGVVSRSGRLLIRPERLNQAGQSRI